MFLQYSMSALLSRRVYSLHSERAGWRKLLCAVECLSCISFSVSHPYSGVLFVVSEHLCPVPVQQWEGAPFGRSTQRSGQNLPRRAALPAGHHGRRGRVFRKTFVWSPFHPFLPNFLLISYFLFLLTQWSAFSSLFPPLLSPLLNPTFFSPRIPFPSYVFFCSSLGFCQPWSQIPEMLGVEFQALLLVLILVWFEEW